VRKLVKANPLAVEGEDELSVLGLNINLMADQLQTQLRNQVTEAEWITSYLQTLSLLACADILTWKISSRPQSKKSVKYQNKSSSNLSL